MDYKKRLEELIRERALKVADEPIFKLSSGKMSNYYLDLRTITLDPEGGFVIGNIIFDMIKDKNPDAIGGLTLGADPIAYATSIISFIKNKPIKPFVVRKEPKGHGTGKQIEGNLKPGENVFIVEDVVTTAGSSLKAAKVVKEFGANILGIIAIVDREEGGEENIKKEGFNFYPIFKVSYFLKK
ncbi:orotate phosphoribosyltransferase [Venenivibrio stagnispumantis]|uniref:Orotate phosphoribosyltransferase n=1 Tax=Venenivibrio stagnispumantis TaxID=407998 RepID=A0AA46ACP2_9AQUI|nr:orotate phosphoribosyltransferase [Venenivibrio stagnispumantis]MCW4572573.1 orotate phosphoribosyltransferase [Venenivibrio stagnispumantis]SMP00386.1 orotate phosphoribosyltransferase [Venenivibrio stagnispumantis]